MRRVLAGAALAAGSIGCCAAAPPPGPSCPEILAHYNLPGSGQAAVLRVEVLPSGRPASVRLLCPSSDPRFNQAVLDGVERKPFPAFEGTQPRVLIIPFVMRRGG